MGYYTSGDIKMHILTENLLFGVLDDGTIYAEGTDPSNILIPALAALNYDAARIYECTGADIGPDFENNTISTIDQQTKLIIPTREVWEVMLPKTKKNLAWDKTFKNLQLGIMNVDMTAVNLGSGSLDYYFQNYAGEEYDTDGVPVVVEYDGAVITDDGGAVTEVFVTPVAADEYIVDYTTGKITFGGATTGDIVATYTYGVKFNGGNLSDNPEAMYRIIGEFDDAVYGTGYFVGYKGVFTKCKPEVDPESAATESLTFNGGEFAWVTSESDATADKPDIQ